MLISSLIQAFFNSLRGLKKTWEHEKAFRLEVIGGIGVLVFVYLWGGTRLNQLFVVFALSLMLMTELLNTGIEKANDAFKTTPDPLIQFSKDAASAAVLISLFLVGVSLMNLILG